MKKNSFQIALTGITGYGLSYLNFFKTVPAERSNLRVVTAINRDENEERCHDLEADGVEVFTEYNRMLDKWKNRIDLCVLPVPIHLHASMALQAKAVGMNVLLEKPLAGCVAQGQALCDADKDEPRIAIGFQDMYRPSTHHIAKELQEGRIGKIMGVRMLTLWPRAQSYYTRNRWAGAVEVDGQIVRDSPINNATAHFVNLALFFAGIPRGEMARAEEVTAELFRARDIASFDTAAIRVQTNTGIPLHLYATHACKENETAKVTVLGEKGSMTWIQGKSVRWEVEGQTESIEIESMGETRVAMWKSILQSLEKSTPFLCTPQMALAHTELVEKLHLQNEIRNLDPDLLVHDTIDGDRRVYLPGIEKDLKRCLDADALPSELGLAWA